MTAVLNSHTESKFGPAMDRGAFLYVLGYDRGPCKIGYSYNPDLRLQAVRRGGHTEAVMLGDVPINCKLAHAAERYAHWLLREYHQSHEWFNVTRDVAIDAIKQAVAPETTRHHDYYDKIPCLIRTTSEVRDGENMMTRFPKGTRERMIGILGGTTGMAKFIREAVEAELTRREREAQRSTPDAVR